MDDFEGNDLDEVSSITKPIEAIKRSTSQKYLQLFYTFQSSSPIRKLLGAFWLDCTTADMVLKRVLPKAGTVLFFKPYESSMTRTFDAVSSSIGWKNIKLAFETMQGISKENGFSVYVVLAPTKAQVYVDKSILPSALSLLLQEETKQRSFSFIDLKPYLIQKSEALLREKGDLLWWRDDTHWNEIGHEVVADVLTSHLSGILSK
jgi:hypothetical protein